LEAAVALVLEHIRHKYARKANGPLAPLQNSLDAFLAIEKYLLAKQGVFRNSRVRGPVGFVLDKQTRCEVDRLFGHLTRLLEAT
jgi:4-hydroxy-tetrahydrodipicolinate synthase